MSIIAVRRNISPNAVFFRQRGLNIEYSLDKVIWEFAWKLTASTTTTGGNVDLLRDVEKLLDKYSRKYYRDLDFKALINIDVTVTTRNDALNNPPERAYNPLRMCLALKCFLIAMRALGLGINNGSIELDDIDEFYRTTQEQYERADYGQWNHGGIGSVFAWASMKAWDLLRPVIESVAVTLGSWSDETIDEYTCCIYEQLKSGEFNYSEFVTAGNTCAIGAWDEIATPQHYASLVTLVAYGDLPTDKCPCEECLFYLPTDGDIQLGVVAENTLVTQNYTVSGSLIRMGSRVAFTIPNMIITDIRILVGMTPYENLADSSTPRVQLIATGGGGFTDLPIGTNWTQINPAHYPLVPCDNFELIINSSTCSACTTAQRATYDQSFASLVFIIVCGILQ